MIQADAEAVLDRLTVGSVEYTITPLYVAPAAQLLFGMPMIGIVEPGHAEGYLARLCGILDVLATLANRHRTGVAAGRLPVRGLVDAAVAHSGTGTGQPGRRPAAANPAAHRRPGPCLGVHGRTGPVDRRAWSVRLSRATARCSPRRSRRTAAPTIASACVRLPDGEAIYDRLIRAHTTIDRSAQKLHRTGLELIERLGEEYRSIGGRMSRPVNYPTCSSGWDRSGAAVA